MHNAFYVFTLQTERTETQNETKPLSRVYVVGTYDLFRNKKKGPESDVRRKQTICTYAHTLTQNFITTENKQKMLPRRERETDLAKYC